MFQLVSTLIYKMERYVYVMLSTVDHLEVQHVHFFYNRVLVLSHAV